VSVTVTTVWSTASGVSETTAMVPPLAFVVLQPVKELFVTVTAALADMCIAPPPLPAQVSKGSNGVRASVIVLHNVHEVSGYTVIN